MAEKKEKMPKSGFDAPSVGQAIPKGYVVKKDKDGRITFVPPSDKKKK